MTLQARNGSRFGTFGLSIVFAVCMIIQACTWEYMLQPSTLYDAGDDDLFGLLHNDELIVILGGFIFLTFFPLGMTALYIIFEPYILSVCKGKDKRNSLSPNYWDQNRIQIISVFIYLGALAVACSAFSPIWNFSAHSYFKSTSPYSILPNDGSVGKLFYWKVYTDVVVFYTVLGALVIIGTIVHFNDNLRVMAAKRIPFVRFQTTEPSALQRYLLHLLPRYISIGEILGLLSVFSLALVWLCYWRWGYDRIAEEAGGASLPDVCCSNSTAPGTCNRGVDPHGDWQIWARVVGHLSTFFISFTMFPVARYSLWESVFGISYERAIKVCLSRIYRLFLIICSTIVLWDSLAGWL